MRLHHVGMNVKSLKASQEFYQMYFGYEEELNLKWGSENILFLKKGDCRLELIEEPEGEGGSKYAFLHIALVACDLEREMGVLKEKGLMPVEGPFFLENDWKVAFYDGPDGEIIELVEG